MKPVLPVVLVVAALGLGGCTQMASQPFAKTVDAIRRAAFADEVAMAAAARPRYAPGDTFLFTGGRSEQVQAVDGARVTWSLNGKQIYVTNGNFALPRLEWRTAAEHGEHVVLASRGDLWPMESGARASYTVLRHVTKTKTGEDRRRRRVYHCAVEGTERISVPSGTFDTFRVECLRYNRTDTRVVRKRIWNYAPEIGHYVRREIVTKSTGKRKLVELVSTNRRPPRPVAQQ